MTRKRTFYTSLMIFTVCFGIFTAIIYLGIRTDIQPHAFSVIETLDGIMPPPANFLYYLTIYSLALFQANINLLFIASVFVLASAIVAKYAITQKFILSQLAHTAENSVRREVYNFGSLLSITLLVAFSVPLSLLAGGHFYLGQITPNVWHNSTTIFLMPFALMLFWSSYNQLNSPKSFRILQLTVLCTLNILIKPSYFFVFCLAFPLMYIRHFGLKRDLWLNMVPVICGVVLLVIEYQLIYIYGYGDRYTRQSGIGLGILSAWSRFSPNIPVSLVGSLLFPVTYLALYWNDLWQDLLLQYSLLGYVIAIAIFATLTETGGRQFTGNFYWQCVVCSYMLFMVIISRVLHRAESKVSAEGLKTLVNFDWKSRVVMLAFSLHVVSGIIYLVMMFVTGTFA